MIRVAEIYLCAKQSRKLAVLWTRAGEELFDGRIEAAQADSGAIGRQITEFTYFHLNFLFDSDRIHLRKIGLKLLKMEMEPIYYDGGTSQRRILTIGQALAEETSQIVAKFPN